jgi:putative endonuclease
MTDDLARRVWEHQAGLVLQKNMELKCLSGMKCTRQEKLLFRASTEKWNRAWKLELIERLNPTWQDLTHQLV